MHVKIFLLLFIFLSSQPCFAQIDEGVSQNSKINLSGFIDLYYAYDFNNPRTNYRQPFLYNHNRHNEFNPNLGLIKISIDYSRYRANLSLHTDTYVNDNYTSEPLVLKNIYEDSAGLSLNEKITYG